MLSTLFFLFETPIKYAVFCMCTYTLFVAVLPFRPERRRVLMAVLPVLLACLGMEWIRQKVGPFYVDVLLLLFILSNSLVMRDKPKRFAALSTISFFLSFGLFVLAQELAEICLSLLAGYLIYYTTFRPDLQTQYLINIAVHILQDTIALLLTYAALRNKRLIGGLSHIASFSQHDAGLYLSVMFVCIETLFCIVSIPAETSYYRLIFLLLIFFCFFSLVFWIRHEIRVVYANRQREKRVLTLTEQILEKQQEIQALRTDNNRLADILREDGALIPAMISAARDCAAHPGSCGDNRRSLLETAEEVNAIYAARTASVTRYESGGEPIPSTDVPVVNAILHDMAVRAAAAGIRLTPEISPGSLSGVLEQAGVSRHAFCTILADLAENAVIAVRHTESDSKVIRVETGTDTEGHLRLCIRDSGIPFPSEVLAEMGIRKITGHPDEGGTGTGLMTLFALLAEYRASFRLDTNPDPPFTKSVTVLFDGNGQRDIL